MKISVMNARFFGVCLLVTLAAPLWGQVTSEYTKTNRANAIELEQGDPDEPGGDWIRMRFQGFGGYDLLFLAGDARSWLNVVHDDQVSDLLSVTMEHAPGSFAHKANEVVEWRGTHQGKTFTPYAIIYRIAGTDESTGQDRTRLLVFHLKEGNAVFAGRAEGAGEGEKARAIADRNAP